MSETVVNEEELLYGDSSTFQMPAAPTTKPQEPVKKPPWYFLKYFLNLLLMDY